MPQTAADATDSAKGREAQARTKVAIIGTGRMGGAIARRLKAGG